jgi:hypothetical protein
VRSGRYGSDLEEGSSVDCPARAFEASFVSRPLCFVRSFELHDCIYSRLVPADLR